MIDRLRGILRERWSDLGLPGRAPTRLSFHLSGDGGGLRGRAIVRVFRPEDEEPLLLAKLPRDGASRRRAIREHDLLRELAAAAPRLAGVRFPRALLADRIGDQVVTVQSVLAGQPLERRLSGAGNPEHAAELALGRAREWQRVLWRATGLLEGTGEALWEPFVRAAHFWLQTLGPDDAERALVLRLLREIEDVRHEPALFGYGHGNLTPATLLAGRAAVSAADWENGRKRQLPWVDPLTFALETALRTGEAAGDGALTGLHDAFDGDGPLRLATDRFLDECFEEGGVPPEHRSVALRALAVARVHRAARMHSPEHRVARRWRAVAETILAREAGPLSPYPGGRAPEPAGANHR
jgi:hypothetical protein